MLFDGMIIVGPIRFNTYPLEAFKLVHPCSPLFTLQRLVILDHSNGIIFIGIVLYDSFYVKNHPPKDF